MNKVYDCFLFSNELDLLEIRLNHLKDVVDTFVLVESNRTFSGRPKILNFKENRDRFSQFNIEHVAVDCTFPNAWDNEAYSREMILRVIQKVRPNDVVLVSDVDEIPPADPIWAFKEWGLSEPFSCHGRQFYYFLNCEIVNEPWAGTIMAQRKHIDSIQDLRNRHWTQMAKIDLGWHFSFLGGVEAVVEKLQAFSHQELNTPINRDRQRLQILFEQIRVGKARDLFGRKDKEFEIVEIDQSFPPYLLQNQDKYQHLII